MDDNILQAATGRFKLEIDVLVLDQQVNLQITYNMHPYIALGVLDATKHRILEAMHTGEPLIPVEVPSGPPGVVIPFRRPEGPS